MSAVLGVSVSRDAVRAVLVRAGTVRWAGCAAAQTRAELTEAVARLAAECRPRVRRARVVLERDVVQARTISPAPPVGVATAARYVTLEAPRLFRNGQGTMTVDGVLLSLKRGTRVLWAAATAEGLVQAVLGGCAQAGLLVESIGPAADVLPYALRDPQRNSSPIITIRGATEVLSVTRGRTWRSRLVRATHDEAPRLATALETIGPDAMLYASAFGAALVPSRLQLLPAAARVARQQRHLRSTRRLAWAAVALWILAGSAYTARLSLQTRRVARELATLAPLAESALAVRRDLSSARAATAILDGAERQRLHPLSLLADLTSRLADSTILVSVRVDTTGRVLLSGFAPSAARVRARLERSSLVRDPVLDGPTDRQLLGEPGASARQWDRFGIRAQLRRQP